jgi:salicylate hydroxylase
VVRTARVQMGSRLIGDYIYHPAGAPALVRNFVMQSFTTENWYDRLEWLYGSTGLPQTATN